MFRSLFLPMALLGLLAFSISACSVPAADGNPETSITLQDVSAVTASSRPVGSTLQLLGDRGAFKSALTIWNALAPAEHSIEIEDELLFAANLAASVVGGMLPISATVYDNEVDAACANLPAVSVATRQKAGCG